MKLLPYLIALFLLSTIVLAVGISGNIPPIDDCVVFEPNLVLNYKFQAKDETGRGVSAYAAGDFKQYVSISELTQIDRIWYKFNVTIKFPEKIEKGGRYRMLIGVAEGLPELKGTAGATARVQKPITICVLYSYKFIKAKFEAHDANINETADMIIDIESLTEQDIDSIRAKIDIYNSDNELIETIFTEEKPLLSGTKTKLSAGFDTRGHRAGNYHAYATLFWDDNITEMDDEFRVGELNVKVVDYTKKFKIDTISKFKLQIESEWNNKLKGVYGDVYVDSTYQFRTPPTNLDAWEKKWIDAFWDNEGYELGEHNATIRLFYEDGDLEGETTEYGKIYIVEELEEEDKEQDKEEKSKINFSKYFSATTLLLIIIILLVIFNILYILKRNKSDKKKK